jgi:hypothetical protein
MEIVLVVGCPLVTYPPAGERKDLAKIPRLVRKGKELLRIS